MLFRKKKVTTELRLEKYWDDYAAQEAYRLARYYWENGKFKGIWNFLASGDKEWAKKQAKHYGLTITTPLDEEE